MPCSTHADVAGGDTGPLHAGGRRQGAECPWHPDPEWPGHVAPATVSHLTARLPRAAQSPRLRVTALNAVVRGRHDGVMRPCEHWLHLLTAVNMHRRGRRALAERTAMSDQMPIDTGQL